MYKSILFSTFMICIGILFCGTINVSAETYGDLSYRVSKGEVTITGKTSTSTDIVIPSEIDGYPVTSIASGAFSSSSTLRNVIIQEGVTHIGENAFYQCFNLTSISLPSSIASIGMKAFYECDGLEKLYIKDLASYLKIDFLYGFSQPMYYADYLYVDNVLIDTLYIPDGIINIPSYAFNGCKNIEKIIIPNSVSTIENSAFADCQNLTSLVLGNGVKRIEQWAFIGCRKLYTVEYLGTKAEFDSISTEDETTFYSYTTIKYECGFPLAIIYNSNGGNKAPTTQSTERNSIVTLREDIPIKEGYKFLGWAKSADATKPEYKSGEIITIGTENITLYAIWQRMVVTNTSVISNIIMVTPTNAQVGDCIIAACYKKDRMVYMDTYSYNGETTVPFVPNKEYDTIKIMVWESLSNLKPLNSVEEITK